MGRDRDTTNNNRASGVEVFGHFDGHDAAEREAYKREGFAGVDLLREPDGVVGESFVVVRGDPVNIRCLEACGKTEVGKQTIVGADAGSKIHFHRCEFA